MPKGNTHEDFNFWIQLFIYAKKHLLPSVFLSSAAGQGLRPFLKLPPKQLSISWMYLMLPYDVCWKEKRGGRIQHFEQRLDTEIPIFFFHPIHFILQPWWHFLPAKAQESFFFINKKSHVLTKRPKWVSLQVHTRRTQSKAKLPKGEMDKQKTCQPSN